MSLHGIVGNDVKQQATSHLFVSINPSPNSAGALRSPSNPKRKPKTEKLAGWTDKAWGNRCRGQAQHKMASSSITLHPRSVLPSSLPYCQCSSAQQRTWAVHALHTQQCTCLSIHVICLFLYCYICDYRLLIGAQG